MSGTPEKEAAPHADETTNGAEDTRNYVNTRHCPEIWYDSGGAGYYVQDDDGHWITIHVADVRRKLRLAGYSAKNSDGRDSLSNVDMLIEAIQSQRNVDYAGSLAGYNTGVHTINGHRVLVKDSPQLLTPKEGDFPILDKLLTNMLKEQRMYLDGWLKVATESLYHGSAGWSCW